MEAGKTPDGKTVDLIDVFIAAAAKQDGKLSADELLALEQAGCPTCGSCSGMFTANSMNCLCEALGMALPSNGTLLATSAERKKLFRRAAQRIVEMVLGTREARARATACCPARSSPHDSIDNAMVLDMAMGGSTNTVLHILAIAREAGVEYDIERINELSRRTPNICKVAPSSKYHVRGRPQRRRHPHDPRRDRPRPAGLAEARLPHRHRQDARREHRRLRYPRQQRQGRGLGTGRGHRRRLADQRGHERRRAAPSRSAICRRPISASTRCDCIREVENAYSHEGGLAILYGNLAPKGAVVKAAGVRPEMLKHTGPAVIFEAETEAYEGIVNGKVKAGDVVVIRYEGPRGGPGMQEMLAPTTRHQGHAAGRQGGPDHRRPLLRRHGRRLHRPRQPRGGRRRSDRPAAARRHHRHRHPRPLAQASG